MMKLSFSARPRMKASGATSMVPRSISLVVFSRPINSNNASYNGRKYWTEDTSCLYTAFYHDIPADAGVDLEKLLAPLLPFPHSMKSSEGTKVDDKPATKWILKHSHGGPGYGVSVRAGFRVFTFFCTSKLGIHSRQDATHEARAEKFFQSIKIAFDPQKADLLADEPEWAAMAKTVGFSALAPKGTSVADHRVGFARDEIRGTEFKSEDDGALYQVFSYDLPAGKTIDKVVTEHLNRQPITQGPKAITIDGYAAEELTYQDIFKLPIAMRSVKVGNRAIVAKVAKRFGGGKLSDMEFDARKAKFFANFHVGAGGAVVNPGPGDDPKPAGTGEFVKGGKVLPFWTAVVLPETKELITCSIRDAGAAKPSGVLRRYGYPDFKLKATYQLPLPVNRMVADEKSGRLYCATVNVYDKEFLESELTFAAGDIQVYSLNKIIDGKLADLENLKPVSTIPIGARISGLEISPKDSLLYASSILQSRDKGKIIWKGRLYKVEADKQKVAGEIDLPDAVWSMRLSPDGSKLYAGGMPLTPGGSPLVGVARPTNVEVVETATWKRAKALAMPGAILEIALAEERVLGVVSSKAEPSLLAVDPVGEVTDVTPRGEIMEGARYIRTSPDGKKLLVSGGVASTNVSYHEVVATGPPRLNKIAAGNAIDALQLGGAFVFSPDGKYAIFNKGVILDLAKTEGK